MNKEVAIITGGTAGIGREVCLSIAKKGVKVVVAGRNSERGNEVVKQIQEAGGEALFVSTNVGTEKDVKELVDKTLNEYGRIDFLFNNAGTEGVLGPLETNTEEVIDEVLSANIKGVILCIKHILPEMVKQERGVIINTASFVGTTTPLPIAVVYGASKSAVLSITQSVAASCEDKNVKVYSVCPWVTDTPMADRLTGHDAEAKAAFGANINPSGEIVPASEIADVVLALFAGENIIKSGEAILVDKGKSTSQILPMSIAKNE
ncbi:MAG: SDR family NAD(P)-dependent oxidoreductase [Pedobacter sp.]|nr:MAG: SDR family NAD(P)-dependent oxidoreductase [Pedobacter sp.]